MSHKLSRGDMNAAWLIGGYAAVLALLALTMLVLGWTAVG